ncbi:LysR family transcriptional regulator [Chitiniphilus purpureus]|uniref:LysR family transcriptional regulator n=1 Tax=Chitiniphilus purpureus TaxID=2981137 RepID=A0ABY6DNA5_9NEIS|nr:LysR family transcriptional regulator [Chitiniphilus sp. CD1]UXY15497.1 LysR family transcriptional regulator [Chitiniphilus sp. CD1]
MLDALSLGQIRTFVAIAEAGSFRAAGLRLRRAQSAISHAVAALEAALNVTLFDRSGRRPVLTDAGRALLEDARSVLLRVDFLRARARGLEQSVELELALVADTLFPLSRLCQALQHWRALQPSVQVQLSLEPLGAPLAALLAGHCTMAIMVGEHFHHPHIELEALEPVELVAVVAATHPLAALVRQGAALQTADLADHLQIVQTDPSALSEGRSFGVLSPHTWRVSEQSAKLALIRQGLGWGRLPHWAVATDLAAGCLLPLPVSLYGPEGRSSMRAYLAHRLDQPLGPAALTLRRVLAQAATQ